MTITDSFVGPILGSILFSLALNFKQMELYHSPAVFAYLLGRCFRHTNNASQCGLKTLGRFIALGVTVILTFAILWLPFTTLTFQPNGTSGLNLDVWVQILKRLFPFQRGIFEGKVANIWCALSVKPFSIRNRIPESTLPLAAAGLTLTLILPPCWKLFMVGKGDYSDRKGNDIRILLWGSASTSLAFFLASFQVHEKGILIALAPISLLAVDEPRFSMLFSIVATWSLWPLLVIDRLTDAYVCCLAIFVCIHGLTGMSSSEVSFSAASNMSFTISWITMILLHLLELFFSPPQHLPDLFPVLWSLGGCGMFTVAYLGTLFALVQKTSPNEMHKMGQSKRKLTSNGTISIISIMGVILLSYPRESEGFILSSTITGCDIILRESRTLGSDNSITQDLLDRARLPLGWESRNAHDSKPILNLSVQRFDGLSSINAEQPDNEFGGMCDGDWICGKLWRTTEHQLTEMGILVHDEASSKLTSRYVLNVAPQLLRLPTAQILEAASFLLSYPCGPNSTSLIEADPSLLTYVADDLRYGLEEYLPNMMFQGNNTLARHKIQTQLTLSPNFALRVIRMGVEGGLEERSLSRALGNAGKASCKAVEGVVGEMGRNLKEWKRIKGGKGSLGG
jgi:hypothetical protein